MNDDVEPILKRSAPTGPSRELRDRVLGAVGQELARSTDRQRRWSGWHARSVRRAWLRGVSWLTAPFVKPRVVPLYALAAVAALAVSIGLNSWAGRSIDARLARVIGPVPLERNALELANEIAAITNAETGRWFYDRIVSSRKRADVYRQWEASYRRMLNELESGSKDRFDEQIVPSHWDRYRGDRRDTSGGERLLRMEDRCPA